MLYSQLKDKMQKAIRLKSYDDILLSTLVAMLKYHNIPETVDTNFLEMYKLLEGVAAIWMRDGEAIACHVGFAGMPDANGIGKDCIVADNAGHTKKIDNWKESDEVVIFFNNNIKSPDLSIGIFSDMLTETDTSMLTLIKDAKHTHIPVVKDQKQKKALEQCFTDIDNGKHTVFVDESILPDIMGESQKTMLTIDITDPTLADKVQYLSQAWDNILSRFYSFNGMQTQSGSKMAQQSVDEINNGSAAAMVIPDVRLDEATKSIDRCNAVWGWGATVELSDSWKHEAHEKLGNSDVEEDDATDEPIDDNNEGGENNED